MLQRLVIVIGTRPEAIKLAPLILAARKRPHEFEIRVVRTSQHRELVDQVLRDFELRADIDLDIMRIDQDLVHVTTEALRQLRDVLAAERPDWVIVQGDTTTSFAGALAGFYQRTRVAHVEAGLRTYDKRQPFPEEANRSLTARICDLHFAPTEAARDNLLREGIAAERVVVTGNTAIDALHFVLGSARPAQGTEPVGSPRLLLTAHRRENQGAPLERICSAVRTLLERHPRLEVDFPVHPSPGVRACAFEQLSGHARVKLSEPLDYRAFVLAMHRAHVILTDSGGVQEEAPSLGKPVLVLRETTERPEALEQGAAMLVGTDPERIVAETTRLLSDPGHYAAMSSLRSPFGDGRAAPRILDAIARFN
ncbi:MAG TPA: UDP-N-acetylglucosamine 2-epimerase (non-hydrolyzing) [Polyangiales bacterium]|nr:UDP-N-acetylglucosamine 2-epimerase (non-hydrolyzing) [Polyangiales bacterium]